MIQLFGPSLHTTKLCVLENNYKQGIYIDIYLDHVVPTELEPEIMGNNLANGRWDGFPLKPTNFPSL